MQNPGARRPAGHPRRGRGDSGMYCRRGGGGSGAHECISGLGVADRPSHASHDGAGRPHRVRTHTPSQDPLCMSLVGLGEGGPTTPPSVPDPTERRE